MSTECVARSPRPSGWLGRRPEGAYISWSYKGVAEKLCGHREKETPRDLCGAPALYKFTMKAWKREPGIQHGGLTCAEHALLLRGWPTLEKMESL